MTHSAILFRFHRAWDVCEQTLELLKALNPGVPIHGMYGGNEPIDSIPSNVTQYLDSIWAIPLDDFYYKWKNGDLCVRWWFKDHGHNHDFQHLYLTEWDMVFTKPLSNIFPSLKADCNYASIFGDYAHVKEIDWYWIKQQFGEEVDELLTYLETKNQKLDFTSLDFAIMGGAIFCRKFLELFSKDPVPSHGNDEVRLSIYSKVFNIPLLDNGLYHNQANRFSADNYHDDDNAVVQDLDHVLLNQGDVVHPLRILVKDLKKKILSQL